MLPRFTILLIIIFYSGRCFAQPASAQQENGTLPKTTELPSKYFDHVSSKAKSIEQKLDRKSEKALAQLQKQEARMKRKLQKIDSVAANNIFSTANEKYKQLEDKLKTPGKFSQYIPHLDSVATSLNFLDKNPQLLNQAKEVKDKLKEAMSKMDALKGQLQKAEDIKKFLKERKDFLKRELSKFGFAKQLKKVNKQAYYYGEQLKEYKAILKEPKRIEKKAMELLSKTKLFKDFMRKNSMLASLFRLPADPDDPTAQASLAGLQTRAQVNQLIQQQIAGAGPNGRQQLNASLQNAQSQLNELKSKILKAGGGSSDAEMPEGFRPNEEKTRSFLKRLELGTNMQTTKASNFFPIVSDLAMSLGYKLNGKSIIGIGISYKLGLGRGWNNIKITNEGVGLRSFLDLKIKGSLWVSGGYELNHRTAFSDFDQLKNLNTWSQSGLIGISKSVPVKSKFFKKTKAMIFWDFLSAQQIPKTNPVVFRVGYNF